MFTAIFLTFTLAADAGPMGEALRASEAPATLRAAFTVRLEHAGAARTFRFDPRLQPAARWQMVDEHGENDELDTIAAQWGGEAAPDGRLFPDDLRASLSQTVEVEDLGAAWRVRFRHQPSLNDGELDVWASERLDATAWLDPVSGRFLRIDHELPRPVAGPRGGRLMAYQQTHFLETEPVWGLSFISGFIVDFEVRAGFRTVRRRYSAQIVEVEFFFASLADQTDWLQARAETRARLPAIHAGLPSQ